MNQRCRLSPVVTACVMLVLLHHLFLYHNEGAIKGYLYPRKMTSILAKNVSRSPPPWWDGGDCGCEGAHHIDTSRVEGAVGGTCGARAWAAGGGQKVIGFSLYGNDTKFYKGLDEILKLGVQYYPDYYVRLYIEPTDQIKPIICPLICQFPRLHICNVRDLPAPLGDLTNQTNDDPRIWRFLPMGDPLVDVSLSRDTDSKFTPREVSAVNEWLASGVALHVMRDHRMHRACILGGTWGVRHDHSSRTSVNSQENLIKLMNKLMKVSKGNFKNNDQLALKEVVWPALKESSMRHESYRCDEYPTSRPFPTQRENMDFVGAQWFRSDGLRVGKTGKSCTYKCRPVDHKDWLYC